MKRKHLLAFSGIFLLTTALVGTAIARELTDEEEAVVCKLKDVAEEAGRDGYDLAFWPVVRKGPPQVSAPLTILLDPSIEYVFVGYCDENCSDVVLNVNTLSGEELKSETDNLSVLPFEPPYTERYQLSLKMTDCSVEEGCVYGLGIFTPRGATVPGSSDLPEELAQFEICK
ncbi:MAG: hypothetical protein HC920_13725 [Oscillatoriales cyanobacterium SM2_3_0]|nr:hypothetical protein [Oscillatoriales cyanobacterium SM2_3_0]